MTIAKTKTKTKAKAKTVVGNPSDSIYELKVALLGTKPLVWRRLEVPGDANFNWLHAVLQVAMGWTNSHLHHFLTREGRYTDLSLFEDQGFKLKPDLDENQAMLAQVAPSEGDQFDYEYDFGDSWRHQIKVKKILPATVANTTIAVCLAGEQACPPEDCGGVWGYAELLETLKNPDHPEHESMKEWLDRPFDAAAFNLKETNRWLRELKWPYVTQDQLREVLMARDGYVE